MEYPLTRRALAVGLGAMLVLGTVLPGCSDDPILGPSDGTSGDGGSYSALNRLAPPATAVDSSQSASPSKRDSLTANPERF